MLWKLLMKGEISLGKLLITVTCKAELFLMNRVVWGFGEPPSTPGYETSEAYSWQPCGLNARWCPSFIFLNCCNRKDSTCAKKGIWRSYVCERDSVVTLCLLVLLVWTEFSLALQYFMENTVVFAGHTHALAYRIPQAFWEVFCLF